MNNLYRAGYTDVETGAQGRVPAVNGDGHARGDLCFPGQRRPGKYPPTSLSGAVAIMVIAIVALTVAPFFVFAYLLTDKDK